MPNPLKNLQSLEGQSVAVALVDGCHTDDQLVSMAGGAEGCFLNDDVDALVLCADGAGVLRLPVSGRCAA
jgi:hypothetical protein